MWKWWGDHVRDWVPFAVAIAFAGIWLWVAGWMLQQSSRCQSDTQFWFKVLVSCLTPNEIGDMIAGVFAPVALMFVAAAVVVQVMQLRAQASAITEQGKTTAKQIDTLAAQLETAKAQVARNAEVAADEQLEAMASAFIQKAERPGPFATLIDPMGQRGEMNLMAAFRTDISDDLKWKAITSRLEDYLRLRGHQFEWGPLTDEFLADLGEIDDLAPKLSKAGAARYGGSYIPDVIRMMRDLVKKTG